MSEVVPYLVVGITTGSVYALSATGLVLTYKTSGVFNFAHGSLAAASAFVFYEARDLHGLPWPVAGALAVGLVGVIGGLCLERFAAVLARAPVATRVVATVGLLVGIQGIATIRYGAAARNFRSFLPTRGIRLPGVNVSVDQIIIVSFTAVTALGMFLFFRRSRLGIAMIAVVEDADLLALQRRNPNSVRRWAWIIGSSFASLSGLLLAPTIGLDAGLLTLLIVQAFGAAAVGAFTSLPLTYVGGLVIGVGQALSSRYLAIHDPFRDVPSSLPFLVLLVVLVFSRKGRFGEHGSRLTRRLDVARRLPWQWSMPLMAVGALGLVLVPWMVGTRLPAYTNGLVSVILFASLGLLVRTSGQVSLCHLAFAAVGAATFAHAVAAGAPWLLAVVAGGVCAVPVGAVLAIPAVRLSGIYLAIATFGFGILVQRIFYATALMFGGLNQQPAPRPSVGSLGGDTGYYFVVLAVTGASCLGIVLVQRTRLGRLLRALGDSPVALAAHGTRTKVTRLLVFCIAAFLAGIAGAVSGPVTGSTSGTSFEFQGSLVLIAVLAITGRRPVASAFLAAAAYSVFPTYVQDETLLLAVPVFFAVAALVASLTQATGYRLPSSRRATTGPLASPLRERLAWSAAAEQ